MSSLNRVLAVTRKEFTHELRSPSGVLTSVLFGGVAVIAISLATADVSIEPTVSAGLLWVVLLFAGVLSMPRTFLAEEEQGTGDLLRLLADPEVVYWGKGIYNFVLMQGIGILIAALYIVITHQEVEHWNYMVIGLIGGCGSIAGAVTLCSAIAARSANSTALTAAISLPMLLFLVTLGTSGMRAAFGADMQGRGLMINLSMVAYAIGTYAIGSMIFPEVWKK